MDFEETKEAVEVSANEESVARESDAAQTPKAEDAVHAAEGKSAENKRLPIPVRMRIGAIVAIVGQVVILLCYIFHMATLFETRLDPVSALDLILNIFSFRAANAYRYIVGFLFGIAYFLMFIPLLKHPFHALRTTKLLHSEEENIIKKCMLNSFNGALEMFLVSLCYTVLASLFSGAAFSFMTYLCMVVAGTVYLAREIFSMLTFRKTQFPAMCFQIGKNLLSVICLMIIFGYFQVAYAESAINGFRMLFSGNIAFGGGAEQFVYIFFAQLLQAILYVALFFRFIVVAYRFYFGTVDVRRSAFRGTWIFIVIFMIVQLIFQTPSR